MTSERESERERESESGGGSGGGGSGGKRRRSSSDVSSSTRHHHDIVQELQELVPCQTFDAGKMVLLRIYFFRTIFFFLHFFSTTYKIKKNSFFLFSLFSHNTFFLFFIFQVFVDHRGDQEVELGTRSLMSAPHVAMSTYSNIDKGKNNKNKKFVCLFVCC